MLEVLVCLAVVALLSAVFGVKGKELLDNSRVQGSIDLVSKELEKTKFLSLAYRSDIELFVVLKKQEYYLQLVSDEPGLKKIKSIHLPGITDVVSQGKSLKSQCLAKFSSGELVTAAQFEMRGKSVVWRTDDKAHLLRCE